MQRLRLNLLKIVTMNKLKTLILYNLICLCSVNYANDFTNWFDKNNSWNYEYHGYLLNQVIEKDTSILGLNSYKLKLTKKWSLYEDIDSIIIRQENNKIYFHDNIINEFKLLYDFNALVGDTITVYDSEFDARVFPFTKYPLGQYYYSCFKYRIDSIDSVLIDGKRLKRQLISAIPDCNWNFYSYRPERKIKSEIIEKIGSNMLFFGDNDVNFRNSPKADAFLRCYNSNNLIYFTEFWPFKCDEIITSNIPIQAPNTINISPNPATDFIRLEVEGGNNSIQILNTQGQVVYQEKSSEKILNINTQNFASGIYFVIVTHHKGNVSKGKFVKL